jgi:hypothetical protein
MYSNCILGAIGATGHDLFACSVLSCTKAKGMFKPTHFPRAPIHTIRYSSAVVSFLPILASITSAVWHGWMKKTGRFEMG